MQSQTVIGSLVLLLLLTSAEASAQSVLRGELFDSLRTNRPIAAGTVMLLGGNQRAVTDAQGRFVFAGVPAGPATIVYGAPWLDSLGIEYLRAEVPDTRDAGMVRLATPSLATLERMLCGAPSEQGRTVIVGEVRGVGGAPREGMVVAATWRSLSVEGVAVQDRLLAFVDTTDQHGTFTLCGLPVDEPVILRSAGESYATGELEFVARAGVQRFDLIAGDDRDLIEVRGRIMLAPSDSGASATPAAGVQVLLSDDTAFVARTDSAGRFRIRIPRRSSSLLAKTPGLPPSLHSVPLLDAEEGQWTIQLRKPPVQLDAVAVIGERFARERQGFEERRLLGTGRFVTEDEIKKFPIFTPTAIQSMVPRTRAVGKGRYTVLKIRSGFGFCDPRWFENGYDMGRLDAIDQDNFLQRAKRVEIYTAAEAPPKFNDNDGCGAVVVWTR